MNRRELIKRAGVGIGLTMSYGSLIALVSSCRTETAATDSYVPQLMTQEQITFLKDLSDSILPRTDTPSASDVETHQFIDNFVSKVYGAEDKAKFKADMAQLMKDCSDKMGKEFSKLSENEKAQFVKVKEEVPFSVAPSMWGNTMGEDDLSFYRELKSMILLGYFTSKKIGTEVLDYTPVPGVQIGCRPLEAGDRVSSI